MSTAVTTRKRNTGKPADRLARGLLQRIGNTPLLELEAVLPGTGVRLLGKWEGANPSGSLKDRVVMRIVKDALEDGSLKPGMTVVEASSGNTGIAMGMVGALTGIPMRVYMPETKSLERRQLMRFWGVELMLTGSDDPNSHIKAAEELVRRKSGEFFYLNQNGCEGNVAAHADGTAAEIWSQTGGRLDVVVASLGTSGTLMGLARYLKARRPDLHVIGVQPAQAQSRIEGLLHVSPDYVPPIYDDRLVDETIYIEDEAAIEMARRLAATEGLFCGISSGACVAAVQARAEQLAGRTVAVVLGDRGDRYLSTDLFAGIESKG